MNKVEGFKDEFRFLSNFYPAKFFWRDRFWNTSEHAYQAAKADNKEDYEMIANLPTPSKAKREGKKIKVRKDWNSISLQIMEEIVRAKFQQNSFLKDMLLETKDLYLEETNTWNDTFWGVCNGKGQNNLGKILMKIRDELKQAH